LGINAGIFGYFSNPRILIASHSPNTIINCCDIVEAEAGNVYSTSDKLFIYGGTSSAAGNSWIFVNQPASKIAVSSLMLCEDADYISIEICSDDAINLSNPPDFVFARITSTDLEIGKNEGGTESVLDTKADVVSGESLVTLFYDGSNLKVYFNNELVGSYEVAMTISAFRIRVYDSSTSKKTYGYIRSLYAIVEPSLSLSGEIAEVTVT